MLTALRKERNAAQGAHFAALAFDMLMQGAAPRVADSHPPAFRRGIGDLPVDHPSLAHAQAAADALTSSNKVGRQVDFAAAELKAVLESLRGLGA